MKKADYLLYARIIACCIWFYVGLEAQTVSGYLTALGSLIFGTALVIENES